MASSSLPNIYTSQDEDTFVDETQYVDIGVDEDEKEVEVEPPQATGSKRKHVGKERAECWKSFKIVHVKEENGFIRKCGKCLYCGTLIKADPIKNGTTGLKKHAFICDKRPDVIARKKQPNLVFKNNYGSGESSISVWKHDENEIKKALLDFFVCAEIPFKLVEHWAFVRLINACNGKVKLPSRHKLPKDIANYYLDERQKLYAYLSNPNNTVHLTTDTWISSCQRANYMVVTGHFRDDDWVMHKRIINFRPIESHKGDDIGSELMECIRGWGIKNVMTMTLDNASTNDKVITYVLSKLENKYKDGTHFHVRCMAHIINLIVKDGLTHENYHLECIQKAVRYIRPSTQWIKKFKDCMKEEMVESDKFLCGDCPTRWNSTYEMLKRVVELKDIFFKYEGIDTSYERDLDRVPGHEDFGVARQMVSFLEKFKDKTVAVSASTKPLAHIFFDILAIQISTVASESAFSTGGRVLDPYRTRLSPQIVEALICTQDWVKKSSKPIFEDEVKDILNDDDIAIEMEAAVNMQNKKGKEKA